MTKKIRILTSGVTNPWFNLATEDWIFRNLSPDVHTLFLWRNAETVVIGRYQNPWVECKTDKMEQDNIYLARRQSGGGAVFHDLGNTNFTFLSPSEGYDQSANFEIIIKALENLGINAEASGRNDITVNGSKISGSAFKYTKSRKFHHGTLLVNTNMTKLGDYLNPNKLKLAAKGIKSVRSRVKNLVEFNPSLNHEIICDAIIKSFSEYYGQTCEVEILDEAQLRQNKDLNKFYEKMADWDWRFGKTPQFSHHLEAKFDWGLIEFHLDVKKAVIEETAIFSDALDTELIGALDNVLNDTPYRVEDIHATLDAFNKKHEQCWEKEIKDIQDCFTNEVKD